MLTKLRHISASRGLFVIRKLLIAAAACSAFTVVPAWAQSGRIFAGAPLDGPKDWPVGSGVPTGKQTFPDSAIVRDRNAQGALKANIVRALEPDFDVTGDVTVVDGPQTGGIIGLFKHQVMLSVPVRFHAVATLDSDFSYQATWYKQEAVLSLAKGTLMYKRSQRVAGSGTVLEDWCGTGTMATGDNTDSAPICFMRTTAGHTIVYAGDKGYGEGAPFYRAPGHNQMEFYDYHGAYPAMTPIAQAPFGMTAELLAIPLPAQTTFVWVLKKGEGEEATIGYTDDSMANSATGIGPYQILRLAWVDIVFKMENHRLNYVGFLDVLDGHPELTEDAHAYDAGTLHASPLTNENWTLGALEFDRDSLRLDTAIAPGEAVLNLKAHIRRKVRLLEGRKEDKFSVEPGDVFYAVDFQSETMNGELVTETGWCGRMRKPVWYGGDFQSGWQACFLPNEPETATQYSYAQNWEVAAAPIAGEIFPRTGALFTPKLPNFEPVPNGPEDDRDVVIHVRRDRKDARQAMAVMAFRTPGGEKEKRTWVLHFDADGVARLNLWNKALVIARQGDGLKAEMVEGDGRGFRPVY